jgi:hypothetical protein
MSHTHSVRKPDACVPSAHLRPSRPRLRPLLCTALALLACFHLGCPAAPSVGTPPRPSPAPPPRPRQGAPSREVQRQTEPMTPETQQFTATARAITCRMEGRHAASVGEKRDVQKRPLADVLAELDRVAPQNPQQAEIHAWWRTLVMLVYAHPTWTSHEAARFVENECLRRTPS